MNKVAHYLQEHIIGEIVTSDDVRRYFSADCSIFTIMPMAVAYPKNENDIRKITRFTWQLAERGRVIPVTVRGMGSNKVGSAIGSGVTLVTPAHMNKILEFDSRSGEVAVEPGLTVGKLQQTLFTHGRFLPFATDSLDSTTIGGAVASNDSGINSAKYGATSDYVKGVRAVLANGEVIETRKLSKRELSKKMGLSNFEGEIYRSLDKLLDENKDLIKQINMSVSKNSAGYNIVDVRQKSSFDLTPLLVGSEGTLGIITETIIKTELHNSQTTLVVGFLSDIKAVQAVVTELKKLPETPSAIEMIDGRLLELLEENYLNKIKGTINKAIHKAVLFIEFDNTTDRTRKKLAKKTIKILEKFGAEYQLETDQDEKAKLWSLLDAKALALTHADGDKKSLPITGGGCVPVSRLSDYIDGIYKIYDNYSVKLAIWGNAGDGSLQIASYLDISQVGDRQKMFRIIDEINDLVISLGGTTSGHGGDGRLKAPYLSKLYGDQVYDLMRKVKSIFDPYNTLNPGVKIGVTQESIRPLLRDEYTADRFLDFLPKN